MLSVKNQFFFLILSLYSTNAKYPKLAAPTTVPKTEYHPCHSSIATHIWFGILNNNITVKASESAIEKGLPVFTASIC